MKTRASKIRKVVSWVVLSLLAVFWVLYYFNPGNRFRIELNNHALVSTEVTGETEHIIGYGIDVEKAEGIYKSVQRFFSADYTNPKVKIYLANTIKQDTKSIGKFYTGIYYLGINLHKLAGTDIIIYNGEDWVLFHELVHLFFNNMKRAHRNEALAQVSTKFVQLQFKNQQLQKACNEIYQKYRARIFSEILKKNQTT